jgi:tetratricopeptide (TPR) repeat protein
MVDSETESYYQSPLFREALKLFQTGQWEDGLTRLAEVEKKFPLNLELRTLRQEMQVRARVEDYEVEDAKKDTRKRIMFYVSRVGVGVLLIIVMYFAASTYLRWLQDRWQTTLQGFNAQVVEVEAAVKYRNAQNLLQAGYAGEALTMFEELAATNPELDGLETYIGEAKALQGVGERYAQALDMLKTGDQKGALAIFVEIEAEHPLYRDVALQVQTLESQVQLSDVLTQADEAFMTGDWEAAITGYEAIRAVDMEYKVSHVEEQLYQSYLNAADRVLLEPTPTLEALQLAESYFSRALSLQPQDTGTLARRSEVRGSIEERLVNKYLEDAEAALVGQADSLTALRTAQELLVKALELRPDDATVLLKFQAAQNYLAGIDAYNQSAWDQVVTYMEKVVGQDPDFAQGTARQVLYEALISRGDNYNASGEYLLALDDYQRAAIMARQMSDSTIGEFEAQTRIAEAKGLLGDFQNAVFIYQAALASAGLRETILFSDTDLSDDLRNAEAYATSFEYQTSFNLYRKVMLDWVTAVGTETYSVQAGDYLPMLARRYNTTVSAILAANGLTAQIQLKPDTELTIPTTP